MCVYIYTHSITYIYIYIYIQIYITDLCSLKLYIQMDMATRPRTWRPCTPSSHSKNPRHKIFAKGWVAQKTTFDRYLDGCAKTFQDFPRVGSEKTGIF